MKLTKKQTAEEMEKIIKKVFLANQHMVMEQIAKEIGIKKEVLYFAFVKNFYVRKEIMHILNRHQDKFLKNLKGVRYEIN